jgi:rod shape-determining protein MreC
VVTSAGVVGRILRVEESYADVLTIIDANAAVDSLVQRTRARGVVEGQNFNALNMRYLQREDDVISGDTVITSGMGGDYPKGIVVGYVTDVQRKPFGISQKVMLQPSVDFSKIEEVFVVTGEGK